VAHPESAGIYLNKTSWDRLKAVSRRCREAPNGKKAATKDGGLEAHASGFHKCQKSVRVCARIRCKHGIGIWCRELLKKTCGATTLLKMTELALYERNDLARDEGRHGSDLS
jgi:hypothetical protein